MTLPPTTRDAERAVATLLRYAGVDPDTPELAETPGRVVRALAEMTSGYEADPAGHLKRAFSEWGADGLVVVDDIHFVSLCEHHLLPFSGTVTIGYLPLNDRVIGLSKLARLVEAFARRLQLQERLGREIADILHYGLPADGAGVVIRAAHSCMTTRGVNQPYALTTTTSMVGVIQTEPYRSEFLDHVRRQRGG